MSVDEQKAYKRGKYYLDFPRGYDGNPTSRQWHVFWNDEGLWCRRRENTGQEDLQLARDYLDERFFSKENKINKVNDYNIYDVFSDYFVEHASKLQSAINIKYRLKLFLEFIDHEIAEGAMQEPVLPAHIHAGVLERFRLWALAKPIVAVFRTNGERQCRILSRPRSAAAIEEIIRQYKSTLFYAYDRERLPTPPRFKVKHNRLLRTVNRDRISIAQIGELLDYSIHGMRKSSMQLWKLHAFRRYLIAAIFTLGRKSSIVDMNVSPARQQWLKADRLFDLNPAGRLQTSKRRAIIPVHPVLEEWFERTDSWFICLERHWRYVPGATGIEQRRVMDCEVGWRSACGHLGMPKEWTIRLLRHSMAAELRRRGVHPWELAGFLGHTLLNMTEVYAIYDPQYLSTVSAAMDDIVSDLRKIPGCADALSASFRPTDGASESCYISSLPNPCRLKQPSEHGPTA